MFDNKLEFKGAVIGMVLGGATIAHRNRKTAHIQLLHKQEDEEYVFYKAEILRWLNETKCRGSIVNLKGKEYPYVSARTLSHPFYTNLSRHMYYDNRKTVNEHVMKCLSTLGLALWYCDDGILDGEVGDRCPFMCTHHFNEAENELMARMIFKRFGITFRAIKKNVREKTYFWLRLKRDDRGKFFDLIKPFVPLCMKRKIDPSFYANDTLYHIEKVCKECGEKFLVKKRSSSNFCNALCRGKYARKTRMSNCKASVEKTKIQSGPSSNIRRIQK